MTGLKKSYYILLALFRKLMPKLYAHFLNQGYVPTQQVTHWFMTVFSTKMPIELTLRIWDIFFIEGHNILYRLVLAIYKANEKDLLKCDYENIFATIKEYLEETNKPFSLNRAES